MGVRIQFVVFVVCQTGICFTQCDMFLHHQFEVLKCFSSQLSVSFDADLFLRAFFVWQIPAHWIPGSTRDVFDIWTRLKEYSTLDALTFFYQEILAENSIVGQFEILPNTSPSFDYNALIFYPFSVSHLSWTAQKSTDTNLWGFILVKYVFWSSCFFVSWWLMK